MSRTFAVHAIYNTSGNRLRFQGGRYVSSTPSSAAKKAFTQAYRYLGAKGKLSLEIHMRETTQGSNQKVFKYNVKRVNQQSERVVNGETIVNHFTTKVKAII